MKKDPEKKPIQFIRKRCAHLRVKEIEEAEERFKDYIDLTLRILTKKAREEGINGKMTTPPLNKKSCAENNPRHYEEK